MIKDSCPKASPVVILAAGLSDRMGMMKPLLKFNWDRTFLEHIVKEYESYGSSEIIVVTNDTVYEKIKTENFKKVKFIINKEPQHGRMSSVIMGVSALTIKNRCFIHNCDNPFVNISLLRKLEKKLGQGDYIVPVYERKGGHPILISGKVINKILKEQLVDSDFRDVLKAFIRENTETSDNKILCNINTLEDYKKYFCK